MLRSSKRIMFVCLAWLYGFFSLSSLAMGQPGSASVLEQLETNAAPSRGKNGKVDTDIHPADVIHWKLAGHDFNNKNKTLSVTLALTTERQFTIYEDKLKFEFPSGWKILSKKAPKTSQQFDPISQKNVSVYTGGPFDIILEAAGTPTEANIQITYVGCTQVICLFPFTDKISIPWTPSAIATTSPVAAPTMETPESTAAGTAAGEMVKPSDPTPDVRPADPIEAPAPIAENQSQTFEEQFAQKVKAGSMTLSMLLLIAFLGGLLTNLTPCVAPMIPITIRLLAHQTVRPLTSSAMYALGIIATYTALGVVAALSGALFGNLIAHPAVSITFGLVMFLLGLNMLGFGDLSRLQQIGGQIGSSKGGAMNAFLMGAGAGLVASPCTGPILAALLTYTAGRQNTLEAITLLGTYSAGFALPYVFLGASAAKLSKVRVNFKIQILTKLVFASVMFALSLYFMRIPLYGLFTQLRPYWTPIGLIGILIGIIFSAAIILRVSLQNRKEAYLLPTLALGVGVFFGIQALTRSDQSQSVKIEWYHSESEAIEAATLAKKPILVDAWAEWCEACKKMDVTTFADPDVIEEMRENWIALKFDLTEINDANSEIQDRYELQGLPTLTMLPPSGDLQRKHVIAGYSSAPALLDALRKNHDPIARNP